MHAHGRAARHSVLAALMLLAPCLQVAAAHADAPASAPIAASAPAPASGAQASKAAGEDGPTNTCDNPVYMPTVMFEYAYGRTYDSSRNQGFPAGSDTYQRLMVQPPGFGCARLMLQHAYSSTSLPGSPLEVTSLALIGVGQDLQNRFGGHAGLGVTRYSGLQNFSTLDFLIDLRLRIVGNLAVDFDGTFPMSNLIKGSGNTPAHGFYGISLRLDWRRFGVRYGYRMISLDTTRVNNTNTSVYRSNMYTSVIFKF